MVHAGRERQTDDPLAAFALHRRRLPVVEVAGDRHGARRCIGRATAERRRCPPATARYRDERRRECGQGAASARRSTCAASNSSTADRALPGGHCPTGSCARRGSRRCPTRPHAFVKIGRQPLPGLAPHVYARRLRTRPWRRRTDMFLRSHAPTAHRPRTRSVAP